MHPLATLVVAAASAAAVSFGILQWQRPGTEPHPDQPDAAVAALQQQVQDLREQLAQLQAKPGVASAPAPDATTGRTAVATLSDDQVATAVQRYLQQRGGALLADAALANAEQVDVPQAIAQLQGAATANYWQNSELWKKLHAAGKLDEVIATFEANAKANPNDPQAQMDLGNAYLAYLQLDSSKVMLSMSADKAFDRALEIDPTHWEARFTKAVSYTFWPDFLGKKNEAIKHFETLIQQQDSMPPQPGHAETYLYLGNILDQRGDTARAREVWQRGLSRHPNNQQLQERLRQGQ